MVVPLWVPPLQPNKPAKNMLSAILRRRRANKMFMVAPNGDDVDTFIIVADAGSRIYLVFSRISTSSFLNDNFLGDTSVAQISTESGKLSSDYFSPQARFNDYFQKYVRPVISDPHKDQFFGDDSIAYFTVSITNNGALHQVVDAYWRATGAASAEKIPYSLERHAIQSQDAEQERLFYAWHVYCLTNGK